MKLPTNITQNVAFDNVFLRQSLKEILTSNINYTKISTLKIIDPTAINNMPNANPESCRYTHDTGFTG